MKISHILEIVRFKKFEVQLKFKAAAERINLNKRSIKFGEMEPKNQSFVVFGMSLLSDN